MLKKIVWPKSGKVTGDSRRSFVQNAELYDLYCSPSVIRVIRSRRARWAGHMARMV